MNVNTNHRGQTASGRFTYRPLLQLEPDDFPPDSRYWQLRAETALRCLCQRLGLDRYQQWCETVLTETDNWRDIHHKAIVANSEPQS